MTTILDIGKVVPTAGVFGEEKRCVGTVELVEGKFGKAYRFDTVEGAIGGCFSLPLTPGPEWDGAAGISFWVKGNGADDFGSIGLAQGPEVEVDCIYEFPLHATEWRKFTVPWGDFMPFMPSAKVIGADGGWRPSELRELRVGRQLWTSVFDNPAQSFCLDGLQLEQTIPVDHTDYTPTGDPLAGARKPAAAPPADHGDAGGFAYVACPLGQPVVLLGGPGGPRDSQARLHRIGRDRPGHRRTPIHARAHPDGALAPPLSRAGPDHRLLRRE